MPTTTATYTTLPGTLGGPLSQRRSGQSRFYVPDHQGNTRLLTNTAESSTDTLLTDAWGVEIASSGTTVNSFKAFGKWGYFVDSAHRTYVRARHLKLNLGQFISSDPLSMVRDYTYVRSRATIEVDPAGLDPNVRDCPASIVTTISNVCKGIKNRNRIGNAWGKVKECFDKSWNDVTKPTDCLPKNWGWSNPGIDCLLRVCDGNLGQIQCTDEGDCKPGVLPPPPNSPITCAHTKLEVNATTGEVTSCSMFLCLRNLTFNEGQFCRDRSSVGNDASAVAFNFLHEALHCCGVTHGKVPGPPCGPPVNAPGGRTCADVLACCLYQITFPPPSGGDPWTRCKRK